MGQPINLSNRIGFIFDCDGTLLDTTDAWLSMEDVSRPASERTSRPTREKASAP